MRRYLAVIVGLAFAIGGGWFVYFFLFEAVRIPYLLLAGSGFMTVLDGYLIWMTITDEKKT